MAKGSRNQPSTTPARPKAVRKSLGDLGERLAVEHLARLGYQVIETNHRTPAGELDIVAVEGGVLVFVEVRTRRGAGYGTPEESVTPAKARRLAALARGYAQAHPYLPADLRVDVAAVRFSASGKFENIEIIRNAVED